MKKISMLCAFSILCTLLLSGFTATSETISTKPVDLTFGGLISEETISSAGHQQISSKYEDVLNAIEYTNADGTRTVYSFAQPIKYIDEDGAVQRIDSTLTCTNKNGDWETTANWFTLSICNDFSKGVTLSFDKNTLTATPSLLRNSSTFTKKTAVPISKSLSFNNECDEIEYTATNTGYYTCATIAEGTSFGLDVFGDIVSVDVNSHEAIFIMKNGNTVSYSLAALCVGSQYTDFSNTQMSVLPIGANSYRVTYAVTIASAQKLTPIQMVIEAVATNLETSSSTDSSSSRSSSAVSLNSYTDAAVYSQYPSNNYGTAARCLVGVDGTMGKCRSYFRFNLSQLSDIPYDRVLSAHYRIRELTGYTSSFQAVAYLVQQSWAETGITWSNRPDCFDEKLATVNVEWGDPPPTEGNRAYYDFYVTSAVMAWLQGIPNYGIMIKSRVETNTSCRAFASREYGDYIPRLIITYSTESRSMDNIGIKNRTEYYIKNKESNLYLTASGTTVGSSIVQRTWTGSATQKWTVEASGTGYFRLCPSNNLDIALGTRDNSSAGNIPMQIVSRASTGGQQFKFVRNWDGSYQIVTWITNGARGLCTEDNNTTNGGAICHRSHTINWTKTDDWTLEPVLKGEADVYCITGDPSNPDDQGTAPYANLKCNYLFDMGYTVHKRVDSSSAQAYESLSECSAWVFSGHGFPSGLMFEDGYITAAERWDNSYPIIDKPHNSFAKLELALFTACETGLDDTINDTSLVGLMYQKGAHFTIAITDYTAYPPGDTWTQHFLENCKDGQTIYEAMESADQYMYSHPELFNDCFSNVVQRHILGDNSLCLYPAGN